MAKILSQAGKSLADVYDVQGSIAGVDQLLTEDVSLTHDMSSTIFSERLQGFLFRLTSGDIVASASFQLTLVVSIPIYRVMAVYVQADQASRTDRVQVSLRQVQGGREIPMFIWDSANDVESSILIVENDAAATNDFALVQASPATMPIIGMGSDQPALVGDEIVMRGTASAFGAGNVEVVALVYIANARLGGLSSVGLAVPSW